MSKTTLNDKEIYEKIIAKMHEKQDKGIRSHGKRIKHISGMKEYITMYRWNELDSVIELISEPFATKAEAEHFAECFNDSLLAEAKCIENGGQFFVLSGWMLKNTVMSYSWEGEGRCFEFANWS